MTFRKYPACCVFFGSLGAIGSWHYLHTTRTHTAHFSSCIVGPVWCFYSFVTAFGSVHKPTQMLARSYFVLLLVMTVLECVAQYGSLTVSGEIVTPPWLSAVLVVTQGALVIAALYVMSLPLNEAEKKAREEKES